MMKTQSRLPGTSLIKTSTMPWGPLSRNGSSKSSNVSEKTSRPSPGRPSWNTGIETQADSSAGRNVTLTALESKSTSAAGRGVCIWL